VRKWTKSACVVIAWCILSIVAVAGSRGPAVSAQANITIASSTQEVLASAPARLITVKAAPVAAQPPVTRAVRPGDTLSAIAAAFKVRGGWQALYAANRRVIGPDPGLIRPGMILTLPGEQPASYTVAPGDTLSGIAAALGVRGGWQALYAANRRVIGQRPGLIRPGTVLAVPVTAPAGKAPALTTPGRGSREAPPPAARPGQPQAGPSTAGGPPAAGGPSTSGGAAGPASPRGPASPGGTVPAGGTGAAGVMPRWLKVTLLAVGLLTLASFLAQPAVAAGERRRRALRARTAARERARGRRAARQAARIVEADYERLIVTYSVSDDTVYVLTPPGEDPRAVLRAARLVLPENAYKELAGHLGAPPGWLGE
jgi:LysM repeat protein